MPYPQTLVPNPESLIPKFQTRTVTSGAEELAKFIGLFGAKYSDSMKITIHLDHMSHCKIVSVIVWYKLVE